MMRAALLVPFLFLQSAPTTPQTTPPLTSLAPLAEQLKPVVVAIQTTQSVRSHDDEEPMDLFRRFFGSPDDRPERRRSLGSGFLIDSKGLIVTNYHVVKGAADVAIKLDDGRELKADVIGRDLRTDVALLKLRGAPKGLPVARLGDSEKLKVGDWVIAIGNPFGLGHTVTAGIVSAKERFFGAGPYDDFIQTDASINPGNSGGPLFNTSGEVVGVSAAIIQGGQGIGFAIPINIVKNVVRQLETKGSVVRGWIGVDIQEVNENLSRAFHMPRAEGALVAQVDPKGPAARAGVQAGDVILSWNGHPVKEATRLPLLVAETTPGGKAKAEIMRRGQKKSIDLQVGTLKDNEERENVLGREQEPRRPRGGKLGIQVHDVTPELAHRLGLSGIKQGVLVLGVDPEGPAESSLDQGDVITELDGKPVTSSGQLARELERKKADETALLRVRRGKQMIFVAVKMH